MHTKRGDTRGVVCVRKTDEVEWRPCERLDIFGLRLVFERLGFQRVRKGLLKDAVTYVAHKVGGAQ